MPFEIAVEAAGVLEAGIREYVWMPKLVLVAEMLVPVTLVLAGAEVPFCTTRNWNESGVVSDVPRYVTSRV